MLVFKITLLKYSQEIAIFPINDITVYKLKIRSVAFDTQNISKDTRLNLLKHWQKTCTNKQTQTERNGTDSLIFVIL